MSALSDQRAAGSPGRSFPHRREGVADMDVIEAYARISVARGCGFVVLAILCVMAGLLAAPAFALKIGGFFCLLLSVILMLRAEFAHRRSYKDTEVWLMLEEGDRPHSSMAQQIIAGVLRDVYNEFAFYSARAAAWIFGLSFVLGIAGF
jgi:hypothetical protein